MASTVAKFFTGIGAKRFTPVEITPVRSNQHEFNGINGFKTILGTEKIRFEGRFLYLPDHEERIIDTTGILTWYDARENHPTRSEYRLYYSSNDVISSSGIDDLVIIAKTPDDKLAIIVAAKGSTSEKQLLWLFGLEEVERRFVVKDFSDEKRELGFAGKYIISSLGIEIEETAPDYLEDMLRVFGQKFPTTKEFSDYSRSTVKDVSPVEEPDQTLMTWLEREEILFRTLESVIVKERLEKGFRNDRAGIVEFIAFSLSVQNRRKSRAGLAFENMIFKLNNIPFSQGARTERTNKPDFLFPGENYYHDPAFKTELLTMLGVKTTAKDRWRQVLAEAARIDNKHLITLEPAISKNQTDEMRQQNLQLVVPQPLFKTFQAEQQQQLLTLDNFINILRRKV